MKTTEMSVWRRIGTALCLFLMLGFVSCQDDEDDAELFDGDRFYSDFSAANLYGEWDADDDDFLDENEFTMSFYDSWDLDNDGMLEETDWNMAVADFGLVGADWDAWDVDADGILDEDEFRTGFLTYDYYDAWDADNDGMIMDREYADGVFGIWDDDNDGVLEAADYDIWFNRYYGV